LLELPDIAIGAISAAIIASFFSFLGLIISKEQKTSEFRQAWIDSLRSEIAQLISSANAIHGAMTSQDLESAASAWSVVRADFVTINEAAAKVRLRLNPNEDLSKAVLAKIEEIERLLAPGAFPDHSELNQKEKELVSHASALLKDEWRRVKKGEVRYRVAKWGVAVAMVFLMVVVTFSLSDKRDGRTATEEAARGLENPATE
jgi:hypothetical protein